MRVLIGHSLSEYPALFTDSPPVPQSERATPNSSKMPSQFAAVTNKEISQLIKQAVTEIHKEGDEVQFRSFNRY